MSTTQIVDPTNIICGLKAAMTALECYHQMDLLKQAQQVKEPKKSPPPMFMMIPIEEKDATVSKKKSLTKCKTNVPVKDVKIAKKGILQTKPSGKDNCSDLSVNLKLPEMRGGILFTRCYCVHRDGLQDSCPLTSCQGQTDCLVKPWPICPPAKFLRCQYPQQFPPEKN
ncbi:PREDICTED: uncharacterized protein LOC107188706 [Dufourea novaeangliae]|uniref:uncharacterized protein LOC107188706 n=1 Tax=Dufourea novaeangliae TaxID=178035 RepID=UPI000766E720|nr:PREDICTED: uncharacterized protein LOC107188706 [Dufourea novaeangliae]